MDHILQETMNLDRLYYIDIYIYFNKNINLDKSILIKNLAAMQKKIAINFLVSDNQYAHTFLYSKKIDLLLCTLNLSSDKTIHFFCFSHAIMDGYSFILFCTEFYRLCGIPLDKIMHTNRDYKSYLLGNALPIPIPSSSERSYNYSLYSLIKFFLSLRLGSQNLAQYTHNSNKLKNNISSQSTKKNEGVKINFRIPYRKKPENSPDTFNKNMCQVIEKIVASQNLLACKPRFGIPVNIASVDQRKKKYGNYICIVPDNSNLEFCKNYFIIHICIVLFMIFPFKMVSKKYLELIVCFCFNQIDIVYSNIDARLIKCGSSESCQSDETKKVFQKCSSLIKSSSSPDNPCMTSSQNTRMSRTESFVKAKSGCKSDNNNYNYNESLLRKISYSAPVFENKLFTFSCITLCEWVDITIASKVLSEKQLFSLHQDFIKEYIK